MSHDELLTALFPQAHLQAMQPDTFGVLNGEQTLANGACVSVLGIVNGQPIGADTALRLAACVLAHASTHAGRPLVLLIDADSQLMARREELIGLNEYLAHLTKSLYIAHATGSYTVAILYGKAAAGAMIATAMAADALIAVPGAAPSVMDLPSIARVTKLPLEQLEDMSHHTPIFAPGVEPLIHTGAISEVWNEPSEFAARLEALFTHRPASSEDVRDARGAQRSGRLKAKEIAQKAQEEALRCV